MNSRHNISTLISRILILLALLCTIPSHAQVSFLDHPLVDGVQNTNYIKNSITSQSVEATTIKYYATSTNYDLQNGISLSSVMEMPSSNDDNTIGSSIGFNNVFQDAYLYVFCKAVNCQLVGGGTTSKTEWMPIILSDGTNTVTKYFGNDPSQPVVFKLTDGSMSSPVNHTLYCKYGWDDNENIENHMVSYDNYIYLIGITTDYHPMSTGLSTTSLTLAIGQNYVISVGDDSDVDYNGTVNWWMDSNDFAELNWDYLNSNPGSRTCTITPTAVGSTILNCEYYVANGERTTSKCNLTVVDHFSTAIQSISVGGNTPTTTTMTGVNTHYVVNAGGDLVITPETSTAVVTVASPRTQTTSTPEYLTTYNTPPATVQKPTKEGTSNYYYIKVVDGNQIAYYCLEVSNKNDTDLKCLDRPIEWSSNSSTKWSAASQSDKTVPMLVQDGYLEIFSGKGTVEVKTEGLSFNGAGKVDPSDLTDTDKSNQYARIHVSGPGVLKIIVKANSDNANNTKRNILVKKPNSDGTGVENFAALEMANPDDTQYDFVYEGKNDTDVYLYSKSNGTVITSLIWIPSDAEDAETATIEWDDPMNGHVDVGDWTRFKAIPKYNNVDITDDVTITYKLESGANCIQQYDASTPVTVGSTLWPNPGDNNYVSYQAVGEGEVVISATISGGGYSGTSTHTITITEPSPIKVNNVQATVTIDEYVSSTGVVAVCETTTGGTLSTNISGATSIGYSTKQTVVADNPSILTYSDVAPTVEIPTEGTGLIYYYYIKVVKDGGTSYYCLEAKNATGTTNGIRVIDRVIEFGAGHTPFTDQTTTYTSNSLVSGNPYMYVYATEKRSVLVRDNTNNDIAFNNAGQYNEDGTPNNGVIEVRVSGPGTLRIKGNRIRTRNNDHLDVWQKTAEGKTSMAEVVLPHAGYYAIPYTGTDPATFYISASSTNLRLDGLKWEPNVNKQTPVITWKKDDVAIEGSHNIYVQDNIGALAHNDQSRNITYKILDKGSVVLVSDGRQLNNQDTITIKNGVLDLWPQTAGTFVISAITNENNDYYAASKSLEVVVEKRDVNITVNGKETLDNIYTVVGGKSRTSSDTYIAITSSLIRAIGQYGDIADKGNIVVKGDGKLTSIDENGYVIGLGLGTGKIFITWTPTDDGAKAKYDETTKDFDIEVRPGRLKLSFSREEGNVAVGRAIMPYVIAKNEIGEEVKRLQMLYELTTNSNLAALDADQTIITAGNRTGDVTVVGKYIGETESRDATTYTYPYYSASTSDNTEAGANKSLTLHIESVQTQGRLTIIPDNPDYYSNNMASMSWSNETNTASADISLLSPRFVMDCNYMSSDNRFRLFASNNEEIVNNEYVYGVKLSDEATYMEFCAQGSATLQIKGYASVARTLEVYAVNVNDYANSASADATLNDARANLVKTFNIPAGSFDISEEITEADINYYFIKTNNGGIYLSAINWINSRIRPYLELRESSSTITLNQNMHVLSLKDLKLQAYTYDNNTPTESDTKYYIYDNTTSNLADNTRNVVFRYISADPSVATVNPVTGVVTPISHGTTKMYIELEAGTYTNGTKTINYGAQRLEITIIIPDALNVIDEWFDVPEIVYSTISSDKSAWQIRATSPSNTHHLHIHQHGESSEYEFQSGDHLYFSLQTLDGQPLDKINTKIYNTVNTEGETDNLTGAILVAPPDGSAAGQVYIDPDEFEEGDQFRVVARICGSSMVDQQAFYIVTVTKGLTIPTVIYSGAKIKELKAKPTNLKTGAEDQREFYARLNKQQTKSVVRSKRKNVVKEEDITFEFSIPSSTPGLTVKAAVVSRFDDNEKPTTVISPSSGKYKVTVPNPISATGKGAVPTESQIKRLWVNISDGEGNEWDACYKINLLSAPLCVISYADDLTKTEKEATFTSNNTGYGGTIYYTFDSSTPTAESNVYEGPFKRTSNAVFNVVEVFTPGDFVDGSTTFTSAVISLIELEIIDPLVIEVPSNKDISLYPGVENELTVKGKSGNREMRVMFGASNVTARNKDGNFIPYGMRWDNENVHATDNGITAFIDIYSYYISPIDDGGDSNPWTEYNGNFGEPGSGVGDAEPAPYITPVSGAFFRFEPEYNGVATIWIRQNGGSASSAWSKTHDSDDNEKSYTGESTYYLTRRPVFIMDETGTLMQRNTAPYSAEWDFDGVDGKAYKNINGTIADVSQQSTLDRDFMWGWNHYKDITDDGRRRTSWYAMDFYNKKYKFNKTIPSEIGAKGDLTPFDYVEDNRKIPIVDIIYCDNPLTDLQGQDFVIYGYELPMPNYVRYRIPVKAGKTYYMGGRQTKNSFCAVKFDNDGTTDNISTYTLNDNDENSWTESLADGTQINVTLDREFTAGKWSPIVLPFSVSESRLRDMFGDGTMVLSLDPYYKYNSGFEMPAAVNVNNNGVKANLMFTHHRYQMLYANTPAYICPTFEWKSVTDAPARTAAELEALENSVETNSDGLACKNGVTFNRVTFIAGGVKNIDIGEGYEVTGSYGAVDKDDIGDIYFINNVYANSSWTAKMYHAPSGVDMKATRCWIHKKAGVGVAPALTTIGMNMYDGTDLILENMGAGITEVMADTPLNEGWGYNPNVYNLQGITVGRVEGDVSLSDVLDTLHPGIYIYQGRKVLHQK